MSSTSLARVTDWRGIILKVERYRIIPAILIDVQSGGFWGASPPQNPQRLILWKIVTIKGMKSHVRGGGQNWWEKGVNFQRESSIIILTKSLCCAMLSLDRKAEILKNKAFPTVSSIPHHTDENIDKCKSADWVILSKGRIYAKEVYFVQIKRITAMDCHPCVRCWRSADLAACRMPSGRRCLHPTFRCHCPRFRASPGRPQAEGAQGHNPNILSLLLS